MRIVHFFLIESPCPGQSNRKNNEIDKWAPAPWVIQAPQRGYVQFAVPDLDIYLRENAEEILERF